MLKSSANVQNSKRFVSSNQIQNEVSQLRCEIVKMVKRCQLLENENRVLKRIVVKSGSGSLMYLDGVENFSQRNENCLLNKYLSKVTTSQYSNQGFEKNQSGFGQNQSEFKQNHSGFTQNRSQMSSLGSISQFREIRQNMNDLKEGVRSMQRVFEKYEQSSNQVKDMFMETELCRFGSKSSIQHEGSTSIEEMGLQNLLCDEELSVEDEGLQEREVNGKKEEINLVESLIAKGIEFRETRTMKSREYQTLSGIIEQYREEFKNKGNTERVENKENRERGRSEYYR